VRRIVSLKAGSHYIYRQHANHFNAAEENSAIDVFYFVGEVGGASDKAVCDTVHDEAMLNLIVQMVSLLALEIYEFVVSTTIKNYMYNVIVCTYNVMTYLFCTCRWLIKHLTNFARKSNLAISSSQELKRCGNNTTPSL
jgi:hypothetical protein